jgi:hypothetical protein
VLEAIASAPAGTAFNLINELVKFAAPAVIEAVQYLEVLKVPIKPEGVPVEPESTTSALIVTVPPAFVIGLTNSKALIADFPIGKI